jgi:hypothetical protein
MRQNTKIMGPIKIYGEESKFSPRHKYNVELGVSYFKNIQASPMRVQKWELNGPKGSITYFIEILTITICIHSIHLFVEKTSYPNPLPQFMNSHT